MVIIILLSSCDNNTFTAQTSENTLSGVAFDAISLFSNHPTIRALGALKLLVDVSEFSQSADYNKLTDTVHFNTALPDVTAVIKASSFTDNVLFQSATESWNFSPDQFIKSHNLKIGDDIALNILNSQIYNDYTNCTDEMLDSGEGNHIKMLELRIACFEKKGYKVNDKAYMRVKYGICFMVFSRTA